MTSLSKQMVSGFINTMLPKPPMKNMHITFEGTPGSGKGIIRDLIVECLKNKGYNPQYRGDYGIELDFPTEPKTKLIPFTRDTFPREAWVRFKLDPDYNFRVLSYSSDSFRVGDTIKPYDRAINDCELSSDNGKTWTACGQVVEE